jgi:hypothetical protein
MIEAKAFTRRRLIVIVSFEIIVRRQSFRGRQRSGWSWGDAEFRGRLRVARDWQKSIVGVDSRLLHRNEIVKFTDGTGSQVDET